MNRNDRAVARLFGRIARDESLVSSAVGYEDDGRRRRAVLVTDRRIVIAGLRHEEPVELPLVDTSATYDADGGRLTFTRGGEVGAVLRAVEPGGAQQIVVLLRDHRSLPDSASAPQVRHVHIRDPPGGAAPG